MTGLTGKYCPCRKPAREHRLHDAKFANLPFKDCKDSMENLIAHFKYYSEGFRIPAQGPQTTGPSGPKSLCALNLAFCFPPTRFTSRFFYKASLPPLPRVCPSQQPVNIFFLSRFSGGFPITIPAYRFK